MATGDRDDEKKEINNDTTDDDYTYYIDIFRELQFILACLIGVIGICSILLSLYKLLSNRKEPIKAYRR